MFHRLVVDCPPFKKTIDLCDSCYSIGRNPTNSLVIPLTKISRIHATIIRVRNPNNSNYSFYILDGDIKGNKSSNGVYVNGERIIEHELKHGDIIYLADQKLAVFQIFKHDYPQDVLDQEKYFYKSLQPHGKDWLSRVIGEQNEEKNLNQRDLVEVG